MLCQQSNKRETGKAREKRKDEKPTAYIESGIGDA